MAAYDKSRGQTMKKWIIGIVVLGLIIFLALELTSTYKEARKQEPVRTMQATDFSLPTLEGEERSLHEERGKVVIINFWATWCEPCKIEMPHLQSFYEKYKEDVEILAVNVTDKESDKAVKKFIDKYGITFPVLLDQSGDISTMYGAFTIPTTIILNRDGEIEKEILGPMEEDLLIEYIKPLL